MIHVDSGNTMVLLTRALDLSIVFEERRWMRVSSKKLYQVCDELRIESFDI